MKPFAGHLLASLQQVARFTRAWIETMAVMQWLICIRVARFTRAWIETKIVDGLKARAAVARFTRAWIETLESIMKFASIMSPASRGRGLKRVEGRAV